MKENFAVIQLGGAQHIVKVGDTVEVNRIDGKVGDTIKIKEVLLYSDGKNISVGDPFVQYIVSAKIEKQIKGVKLDIIKFKAKSRYRRKIGHRQLLTCIKITKISKETAK